ncbi:MAG TPA: SMP-30/gluconolactonase/LRE family protein [Blastocatellia bacterium]|jgi:sugar lactone lactonase YvrE|nr:SMP-30/gluconolactonase/LRE family protein [Blastocatellia bacterium]
MRKSVVYWLTAVLTLSWIFLPGLSKRAVVGAQQAAPELRRIGPETITAGSPTFTVRLEGRNFESGAKVLLDGVALSSSRVTKKGKVLLAEVDAGVVATPGTHTVAAMNPGGLTTAPLTLSVVERDPNLIIRLPFTSAQEDSGLVFLPFVTGEGLDNLDKVFVWGRSVQFEVNSDNRIQIQIPEGLVNDPGRIPIVVRNKRGNYSNTEIFFIVPRPARLNELDPDTVEVGSEDFLLKVTGSFKEGAVIVVNGTPLPTTERKGHLEATIPASLRSQPGQLIVRIEQDGIQSTDAILTVTPTDEPFIFTIAPTVVRQGEGRVTIDIVGANFNEKTRAFIDGQEATVRGVTRRRLTVATPKGLTDATGTHTIQLSDKDGNMTRTVTFEVIPDVTVSTVAGEKRDGFNTETCVDSADALFRRPRRLAFGPDGLLYITDQQNHSVRTINTLTGQVCTVAGTGEEGYKDSGDDSSAPVFSFPNGVVVDAGGTIYVTENGNNVVRRIRRQGGNALVDTFAGTFTFITDKDRQKRLNSTRIGIDGFHDGGLLEASFRLPDDILIAPDGTIYIADAGNHTIRRIVGGRVETFAGNGVAGFADGTLENARFDTPTGLAISPDGRFLFVADTRNNRVRRVDVLNRRVDTFAGSGDAGTQDGPGSEAFFNQPIGLALDSDGTLYVSEVLGNDVRRIDPSGNVSTLAGDGTARFRDGLGVDARFDQPRGLAIDLQRRVLYVADTENFRIRKIQLR